METRRLTKVYIVDDDPNAIELLSRLLQDYSVSIIGSTSDTTKARDDITEKEPDLLFLDVEMPTMTGLEFWSLLKPYVRPDMRVVFYTGYDKYLLEALRRQAFDYMLKPATPTELAKIMTRYYEQRLSALQQLPNRQSLMIVNAVGEYMVVRFDDIAFFRFNPDRKLWEIVCTDGQRYDLRHRTTADTILNYAQEFVQIHKRYIVNILHVSKVVDGLCVLQPPLQALTELHISKNYRSEFMSTFYNM